MEYSSWECCALCAGPCVPSLAPPRGEWAWPCIPLVPGPKRLEARDLEVQGHPHPQLYGELKGSQPWLLEAFSHKKDING